MYGIMNEIMSYGKANIIKKYIASAFYNIKTAVEYTLTY